jgi:hypothetical protein
MTLLGCVVFVLPRTRWRDWDGWLLAVLAVMMSHYNRSRVAGIVKYTDYGLPDTLFLPLG